VVNIVKIKRFVLTGTLDVSKVADTGDLAILVAGAIRNSNAAGCLGEVVFEGVDGNFYRLELKAVVDQVHPDYIKSLDKDMAMANLSRKPF